jgi:hypothetical protein
MSPPPQPRKLFKIGDLVEIRDKGLLIELEGKDCKLGIVVSEPYMYMTVSYTAWPEQDPHSSMMELEDWCYDVLVGDETIRMMPEEFLEKVED